MISYCVIKNHINYVIYDFIYDMTKYTILVTIFKNTLNLLKCVFQSEDMVKIKCIVQNSVHFEYHATWVTAKLYNKIYIYLHVYYMVVKLH